MSLAKGSVSILSYLHEGTFGTAPTGNFIKILLNNESMQGNRELYSSDDLRSDRQKPGSRAGNKASGGQFVADFKAFQFIDLFSKAFGATRTPTTATPTNIADDTGFTAVRGTYYAKDNTGASTTTSVWLCAIGGAVTNAEANESGASVGLFDETKGQVIATSGARFIRCATSPVMTGACVVVDTYVGASAMTDSIAVEKQILGGTENLYELYTGSRINNIGIQIQQKGNLKTTFDLLSLAVSSGSAAYSSGFLASYLAAYDPGKLATPVNVAAAADTVAIGSDCFITLENIGTGVAEVRPFTAASLQLNNNIDANAYVISQEDRFDLPEGSRSVTGSFTTYFKDRREYEAFRDKTKTKLRFSLALPDAVYLEMAINEAFLSGGGSPTISQAGALQTTFNFEAFVQSQSNDFTLTHKYLVQA
jgi:hypothetical protein